ncbi:tyrosine-protein kinase receptor-like isoform X1 [Branchiostoma lanceolatum]|uniref:tyrosine-protein kinase receptor-like isoform X1 n=1 Tax=Branchiostoma lanceolatum TaxID=7740 RepID=UPI00345682A8
MARLLPLLAALLGCLGGCSAGQSGAASLEVTRDTFIGEMVAENSNEMELLEVGGSPKTRSLLYFNVTSLLESNSFTYRYNYKGSLKVERAELILRCRPYVSLSGPSVEPLDEQTTVFLSKVLRRWSRRATFVNRVSGKKWKQAFLDTSGRTGDATPPRSESRLNVRDCQQGSGYLRIEMGQILQEWLDGRDSSFGVLLWTQGEGNVQFYSKEDIRPDRRPQISAVIQGYCPPHGFPCYDGSTCLSSADCNFMEDCPGGEDEFHCNCDFESSCDWMESFLVEEMGWKVGSGLSVTSTLPEYDYTEDTEQGQYMFVDAMEHNPGFTAELLSPFFGESGPQCRLRFAYHVSAHLMGSLLLHLYIDNTTIELWTTEGQNVTILDQWIDEEIPLGKVEQGFRLGFEYIQGESIIGHVALDDIVMDLCSPELPTLGACGEKEYTCLNALCVTWDHLCDLSYNCLFGEDEGETCAQIPQGAWCDFEDGMCGWYNVDTVDQFDWSRQNGTENTGPAFDNTLYHEHGHYIYIEASKQRRNDVALLRSPEFPPPALEVWQCNSSFFEECKVRFFYHMYGHRIGHLTLLAVHNGTEQVLWSQLQQDEGGGWIQSIVTLPRITSRFYLQFAANVTEDWVEGDIAVDDVSLSPQCFGLTADLFPSLPPGLLVHPQGDSTAATNPTQSTDACMYDTSTMQPEEPPMYKFTTCGAKGPNGPTQAQCDTKYKYTTVEVKVPGEGPLQGIQIWTVPETEVYSISAYGASGGVGAKNTEQSQGAYIKEKFNLTAGEKLYILVGQEGESACSKMGKFVNGTRLIAPYCAGKVPDNMDEKRFSEVAGGGGGGGGASYVFKVNEAMGEYIPLIVAGGGGGKAYRQPADSFFSHGIVNPHGQGTNGLTGFAGGGGGWNDTTLQPIGGRSLVEGGRGGTACSKAIKSLGWNTSGGFGGGGGACTAGGGGGGYTGGDASDTNNLEADGFGGSSYMSQDVVYQVYLSGVQSGDGEVLIEVSMHCDECEYECYDLDPKNKQYKCTCGRDEELAEDGRSCLRFLCEDPGTPRNGQRVPAVGTSSLLNGTTLEYSCNKGYYLSGPKTITCTSDGTWTPENNQQCLDISVLAAVISSIVLFVLIMAILAVVFVYRRKQKQLKEARQEIQSPEYQLSKLRNHTIITDYNPNYTFGGSQVTLNDLHEIPRDKLSLLRPLGQGAFGEVYEGMLKSMPGEKPHLPVAVKTLPELCSEQDEMDFLMEALIISKFDHPNIVRCIGVCFKQSPRFLILELMSGGNLKNFVRENRPKTGHPSKLTMMDLLELAKDVARGCHYLEENHFIHRDIACRNILLTTKTGPDRMAKIGDFGMARDIYRSNYYRKGGRAMLPVKWMPPEAFLDGVFTTKTDVWSFGVLLWEVMSLGYMPYPGKSNQEVMQFVTEGGRMDPPRSCPGPVYRIMTQCWQQNPEDRPCFSTVLERLGYCTQVSDPDVINTSLPVCDLVPEEENHTIVRPDNHQNLTPLQVHRPPTDSAQTAQAQNAATPSQGAGSASAADAPVTNTNQNQNSTLQEAPKARGSPAQRSQSPAMVEQLESSPGGTHGRSWREGLQVRSGSQSTSNSPVSTLERKEKSKKEKKKDKGKDQGSVKKGSKKAKPTNLWNPTYNSCDVGVETVSGRVGEPNRSVLETSASADDSGFGTDADLVSNLARQRSLSSMSEESNNRDSGLSLDNVTVSPQSC